MVEKVFERVLRFQRLPIIRVGLITCRGNRRDIPMVFDTGATTTVLRAEFAPLLGAATWTEGQQVPVDTVSGRATAYRFMARLEVLGKVIECPVHLMELPPNPLYGGLLGREAIFERFGFGFWESTHELLVTANP